MRIQVSDICRTVAYLPADIVREILAYHEGSDYTRLGDKLLSHLVPICPMSVLRNWNRMWVTGICAALVPQHRYVQTVRNVGLLFKLKRSSFQLQLTRRRISMMDLRTTLSDYGFEVTDLHMCCGRQAMEPPVVLWRDGRCLDVEGFFQPWSHDDEREFMLMQSLKHLLTQLRRNDSPGATAAAQDLQMELDNLRLAGGEGKRKRKRRRQQEPTYTRHSKRLQNIPGEEIHLRRSLRLRQTKKQKN